MTMRIRHLRLRTHTSAGLFGADLALESGLNVFWADNTKGKSTSLQGLIYVLGLERMLSPRREVPLTYVMTHHVDDPDTGAKHPVLESYVMVELENSRKEIITVKRPVKTEGNSKLVSVFYGPLISEPTGSYEQRDFFVLDPGAANREAGFHHMLSSFIDWELPTARRFDGSETTLYMETIFPLLYVEQKAGWSSIPAAFPTYFQIRDVGRHAVEFITGMSTQELDLLRQQIELDLVSTRNEWASKRQEIQSIAAGVMGRVEGLSLSPTAIFAEIDKGYISIKREGEAVSLGNHLSSLRARVDDLRQAEVPTVEEVADDNAKEITDLASTVAELNASRMSLFRARQNEKGQVQSIARRLSTLEEDLKKNSDAQKLRNFGSKVAETLSADHCPTCAQPIQDTLLAQAVTAEVMPVEDNIEYIKSQRGIFLRLQKQAVTAEAEIERELSAVTLVVNETSARLRTLRAESTVPSSTPSIAALENRLRLEAELNAGEAIQLRFEEQKLALLAIAARFSESLAKKALLPTDRFSNEDLKRVERLTSLIREQVSSYGFSTFPAAEIEISLDNYRPQKEGFEIGFQLSASDAIRLKWAYQLALLELARDVPTNHLGFVIFDEPRQQATAKVSFQNLLRRAALAKASGQQVIFATSEDIDQLTSALSGVECNLLMFEGPVIRKINE